MKTNKYNRQQSAFSNQQLAIKLLVLMFIVSRFIGIHCFSQNVGVGINTAGAKADGSAILDVSSTTQGQLIPRMTTTQMNAIATPATGLIIYNTDCNNINYYNGATWVAIGNGSGITAPVGISGITSPACNATGIPYSITTVTGATGYNWTVPQGATVTAGQGTTGITVNFGAISGNVCATASNACGTSAPFCLAVTLSGPSQPVFITSSGTVCQNQNGVAYAVTNVAGVTYAWTYSGLGFTCASNCTTNSITANYSGAATTGTLSVTPSNVCGIGTAQTLPVTVNPIPATPTAGTSAPSQNQIVWNWNTVSGATAYYYNTVNTFSGATNNGAGTTYSQSGLSCGTPYNLYVWAYNSCGNSTTSVTLSQTTSSCPPCGGAITLTDSRDSKVYNITEIGTQCWMGQNLNYGTRVNVHASPQLTGEKYCQTIPGGGNDATCANGGLYEWTQAQVICPSGWHLPSNGEWTTLSNYLSANASYWCNSTSANTAASLASKSGWRTSATVCAPGYNQITQNNFSGFNGLPAGLSWAGTFFNAGVNGYWWSTTPYYFMYLNTDYPLVYQATDSGLNGVSVRCLKN